MGKKIPYDIAMKMAAVHDPEEDSIFIPEHRRKCGYQINVNHPKIKPLLSAYHKKIGVPENIHLSGAQRHYFEMLIFKMIEKNGGIK